MRTETPPSPTAQQIGPLLADWHHDKLDDEQHDEVRWSVEAVFDHDFEFHILVKQWQRNGLTTFDAVGYSLWFITCDDMAIFVDEWPRAQHTPYITAAAQVMSWCKLAREVYQ